MYKPTDVPTKQEKPVETEPVRTTTSPAVEFENDFTEDDKRVIREYAVKTLNDTLELPVLTVNDLTHLGMVGHGSIKNRAKSTSSAREIVLAIIQGLRKNSEPSKQRVVNFIESLPEAEKQALLKQLTQS